MPDQNGFGLASTNWALGSLILVGLASSELTGGATLVALPIAALAMTLSATVQPANPTRRRRWSDIVEFLEIWTGVLELLAATATCGRIASATIDYMSRGRFRDWLFGLESHSLGEPWPDVLGVTVMIVATGLFMLGLDKSKSLSLLLYVGLAGGFAFFALTGSFYADTKFWNWTNDFNMRDWKSILTASALCAFAFPSVLPQTRQCLNYAFVLIVPSVGYATIVLVFTLMSHFRELAGTAIPLVRVFEMRDVDWARPVMATCTIFVACVSLTELMPALHAKIVRLASKDWRVLVSSLTYHNPFSGAPVLAVFTAGSLASILAFACPLSYLVRLLDASALIKCTLRCSRAVCESRTIEDLHHEDLSVQRSAIQYSRLTKTAKASPMRRIKTSFDIVPRFLRNAKGGGGRVEDKEYLLMDSYTKSDDVEEPDSQSESAEEESSASSTDIDAVVQEYKDQIQVTTANTFNDSKGPTLLTARLAMALTLAVHVLSALAAAGLLVHRHHFVWPSCLGILAALVALALLPQNRPSLATSRGYYVPVAATLGASLCTALATTLLAEIWFGIVMWMLSGLVLFCRCDCCNCEGLYPPRKERQRLHVATKGERPTFSGDRRHELLR